MAGAAVVLEEDGRWDDRPPAYYVYNFVSDPKAKGAGGEFLDCVERMAVREGKRRVRLDCSADNEALNRYYGQRGYRKAGLCGRGNTGGSAGKRDWIPGETAFCEKCGEHPRRGPGRENGGKERE